MTLLHLTHFLVQGSPKVYLYHHQRLRAHRQLLGSSSPELKTAQTLFGNVPLVGVPEHWEKKKKKSMKSFLNLGQPYCECTRERITMEWISLGLWPVTRLTRYGRRLTDLLMGQCHSQTSPECHRHQRKRRDKNDIPASHYTPLSRQASVWILSITIPYEVIQWKVGWGFPNNCAGEEQSKTQADGVPFKRYNWWWIF